MNDLYKKAEAVVETQSIAFVGSVDDEGFPNMKAMLAPRVREGLHTFYFTTNTSSMRTAQYRLNSKACLYFCDQPGFRGVMLRGQMEVLTDAASRELIWREGDTEYYALGVTDPDYAVLRFRAEGGRYYEAFHSEDFATK